jgi:hypothetical protein
MFRLETKECTSQDDLPPFIVRRLQVEESWARRNVLAAMMNAERLKIYAERRTDLSAGCAPMDLASRPKPATRAATVVPMKHQKSFVPGVSAHSNALLGLLDGDQAKPAIRPGGQTVTAPSTLTWD